ncbi:hypothetical protein PRZ48_009951 [Zasmidium cellare]|uniref:Fanconi-associated nuclease n=1 Tax=Zasmidium cellare TaxID=395010 RepID=A0ABR0ED88_ZASCE|nr:hypothetical protein PRZ48_009951 [Zasmidium cellare]
MLQDSNGSKHNSMLGKKVPHPKSTNFDDDEDEFKTPPAKRLKRGITDFVQRSASKVEKDEIPDSDEDSENEVLQPETRVRQTDLETALPPIETDKEAIEAYEASRAAEQAELSLQERLDGNKWVRGKSSIYVDAFNLALETVLEEEGHLFDEAEHAVFQQWRALTYEAQYLYVRLFLRKTSSWHRINRLGYHSDIADLQIAIDELQEARDLPAPASQQQQNPGELDPPVGTTLGGGFTFADRSQDCIKDLEEASSLLLLDELKAFAKDAKVQGKNKTELLKAFRKASGQQTSLSRFGSLRRSDTEETAASGQDDDSSREATPGKFENRDSYFVDKIMAETGPCIRLSLPTLSLFERVHLVFYRSTEWTEKSLTTIILARIARRNFPEYIVSRSANIFASRQLLLEFEAAVRTQFRVDSILEFNGTPTKDGLQVILDIFDEVYPRWKVLLAEEQRKEDSIYSTGEGAYLRRLSPAWVYTRIVHKAAYVMGTGKFKDHKREHEILCELLGQRLFHTSRRGDWYQRKALLEEHYMHLHLPSPPECKDVDAQKKHFKRVALQTCEDGLQDQLTHLIFHRDLQKRTTKLEKALKIPKRQQHDFEHVRLTKAEERTFEGIRIERDRPTNGRRNSDQNAKLGHRGAKTIWLDPAVNLDAETEEEETAKEVEAECSVEEMCLSSYRALGWKGYHSEGGVLRTLFAYLFYDVLFVYIPNVFQTAYQTCPLDLHSDAFYPSRISEVNARLNEISNGDAGKLIQRIWDEHSERKTCVVGLDWTYALEDLLEIAACFPPAALSTVMKTIVQEYGQRGGGVPDLFLWRVDEQGKGEVMFAEVKSENDRLSDTQRMWIDVLTSAGVRTELCRAVAKEVQVRS